MVIGPSGNLTARLSDRIIGTIALSTNLPKTKNSQAHLLNFRLKSMQNHHPYILPFQPNRVRPTAEVTTNDKEVTKKGVTTKEVKMNPKKLRFSPSIGPLALVQTTRLGVTSQHFEL